MPLASGPTLLSPVGGDVLAQVVCPKPRHLLVLVVISTTFGFDALLQILDGAARVLGDDFVLKVGQSLWTSPEFGPLVVPENGRLQVIMRHTPEVMPAPLEIQATIHYRDWGER